jgi:hypothetical protein
VKRFLLWLGRIERKFLSWFDRTSVIIVMIVLVTFFIGFSAIISVGLNWIEQNELEVIDAPAEELDIPLDTSATWHLEEDGSWTCYGPDGEKAEDPVVCACAKTPE